MQALLKKLSLFIASALLAIGFASSVNANTIEICKAKEKTCGIKLREGFVGDTVSVLNEKGQPVAVGWIVKRDGNKGVIKLQQVFRDVKRGYPVRVNIDRRGKESKWASRLP